MINNHYLIKNYPSLHHQIVEWEKTRPLQCLEILDSTPLFHNTLVKHLALIAAGANLTVAVSDVIPSDQGVVDFLQQIILRVVNPKNAEKSYEI